MTATITNVPEPKTVPGPPRTRARSRLWLGMVLLSLPIVSCGGYLGWRWYLIQQYRTGCQNARLAEDWRTEKKLAREWTSWEPEAGMAWWYAAEAAQKLDDMEDLAYCLGRVPRSDSKSLIAYTEKANLEWTTLNRPLAAVETSRQVLAMDARVAEIQSRLISYYAMTLQRAEMLKTIRDAMQAGSEPRESYPYLMLADLLTFSNGAAMNSRWLDSNPDVVRMRTAWSIHTAMGFAQNADAGQSEELTALNKEAERQFQFFLKETPHDPALLTYLMYRAYQRGNVAEVGRLLKQVDNSGVDDHMVWVYRGWYHLQQSQHTESEAALREALRLHPLSPMAHHEFAKLLRMMRRPAAEIEQEQKLAVEGRELRAQMLHLNNVFEISPVLFRQMAKYAEKCGDQQVAGAMQYRLSQLVNTPVPAPSNP